MQVRVNRFAYIQGKYRDRVKGETIGNDVELVEKMKKKNFESAFLWYPGYRQVSRANKNATQILWIKQPFTF